MKIKKRKLKNILFSIFLYISLSPYIVWGKIYLLIPLVITILFLDIQTFRLCKNKITKTLVITFSISGFIYLNSGSLGWILLISFSVFLLISQSRRDSKEIYEYFVKVYSFLLIPGLLIWFLILFGVNIDVLSIGKINPELVPNQLKVETGTGYILFPGSVMLDYMKSWSIIRFQGMFDEPGVIGTISAFILISEKFRFKNRLNILVLISGLISFSLAFYVLIGVYFLLNFKYDFKKVIIVIILFSSMLFIPSPISKGINEKILKRLEINESKGIQGNNRTGYEDELLWSKWLSSSVKGKIFGIGKNVNFGGSSWKIVFIKTGILGFLLVIVIYTSVYSVANTSHLNHEKINFILVFILSYLQRPAIVVPFFIFIFFVVMAELNDSTQYLRDQSVF